MKKILRESDLKRIIKKSLKEQTDIPNSLDHLNKMISDLENEYASLEETLESIDFTDFKNSPQRGLLQKSMHRIKEVETKLALLEKEWNQAFRRHFHKGV